MGMGTVELAQCFEFACLVHSSISRHERCFVATATLGSTPRPCRSAKEQVMLALVPYWECDNSCLLHRSAWCLVFCRLVICPVTKLVQRCKRQDIVRGVVSCGCETRHGLLSGGV